MSLRRGAPLGGHAGRADVGSAGPQGGPRSGPWPWVCRTAVCGSQALPAGRLVPVPRFLPGFSFFFFLFFLNSEVPLSISAAGRLVLALTSLLAHPSRHSFPVGSNPGSGALSCGWLCWDGGSAGLSSHTLPGRPAWAFGVCPCFPCVL